MAGGKKLGLPPKPEIPTARGGMFVDPPNAAPPTGAVLGMYPGGIQSDLGGAAQAPQQFAPPPVMQSLTPDFTGAENAPAPGVPQTVPTMRNLAGQADEVMNAQPDYMKAREVLNGLVANDHSAKQKKIEDEMLRVAQSVGLDLGTDPAQAAASLGALGDEDASSFGSDGGLITRMLTFHSRQKAAQQANARANAASRIGVLKFYKDAVENGDKGAIEVATKLIDLGSKHTELLKEAGTNERFNASNARLTEGQDEKARHNREQEARLNALEQIKETMAPAQYEMLKAKITGEGLKNQTAQAVLPFAAPLAQAKVLSLNANAQQQAPRTAAMMSQATGLAPTQEMLQQSNMQTPDVVSPPATTQAVPLTPKFQAAADKNEATIANTQAKTTETTAKASIEIDKLARKAENRAKALVGAGTSGSAYWRSNPEAFKILPEEMKQQIKALYQQGK